MMEKIKRRFKIKSPSHIGKTFQGHLAALLSGDACGLRATPLLGAGEVGTLVVFVHQAVFPDHRCGWTALVATEMQCETKQGSILTY